MKQIEMHVYVADEDGVAFQAKITGSDQGGAEVQIGFLDNIDAMSAASLLLIVAHGALVSPGGSEALADQTMEIVQQAQSIIKVRMMREETKRPSRKGKGVASHQSSLDDDSEIPF